MTPDEWLCAILSIPNIEQNFKLVSCERVKGSAHQRVRILKKDDGSVWQFDCFVERAPVR